MRPFKDWNQVDRALDIQAAIDWVHTQVMYKRKSIRVLTLVPNSDDPIFSVEEWSIDNQVWKEIGSGYNIIEAIDEARSNDGTE